jgi:hypothetical protein
MIRKEILIPVAIISLTVVFASVSVFVFFSKGKSKFWISKKIKIGAVLLTLSAISVQPSCRPFVTCYDPVMPNQFVLDNDSLNNINLDISETNKLTGIIYSREGTEFSYNISDTSSTANVLFKGEVFPTDGVFDSSQENFFVEIDTSINPGQYRISFFNKSVELQDEYSGWGIYLLNIK